MDTSNILFQQKLLSNQTLPVFFPTMDPSIDDMIATIGGVSQTFLTPATEEICHVCGVRQHLG